MALTHTFLIDFLETAALEKYFDRPYPYRKLDFVAVPEFWPGGMENPGLITYADQLLLVDAQSAALVGRLRGEVPGDVEAQVRRAYELLFARPATSAEVQLALEFLTAGAPQRAPDDELWREYAQVLLGSSEFLFVD